MLSAPDRRKYEELKGELGEEKGYQAFLRWKCLTDLYFLASEVMGWGTAKRGGSALLDPVFHRWLCRKLEGEEDTLILVPRGHLKSAFVKLLIIQWILQNPNIRVGFYSITQSFVESQLRTIKRWLQTPLLRSIFPEIIPDESEWNPNTRNQLTMKRFPELGEVPQECQIEVFGVGNTVTGRHFDKHAYDDLIDKERVRTIESIEKTREWFSGVQPVLEATGQEIMVGTPYHYNDLNNTVLDEGIFDKKNIYIRQIKEGGKFIYKWWNEKRFRKATRGMTAYDIQSQYYCNPQPVEDMAFPPPQPTYDVLPPGEYTRYITVDPAATTKQYSDETAIVIAAVSKEGMVYYEKAFHGKWPGNETAKTLISLVVQYQPRKVGIEYGLQEHLKYIIDNEKSKWEDINKRSLPMYVEPIRIQARQAKFDRVNWTLGSFVREGKVKIHRSCLGLMAQMDRFSKNYSGKDDIVDAAAMVFQLVEIFSFKNYTKQDVKWVAKDYFVFEDEFKEPAVVGWNDRFVK